MRESISSQFGIEGLYLVEEVAHGYPLVPGASGTALSRVDAVALVEHSNIPAQISLSVGKMSQNPNPTSKNVV